MTLEQILLHPFITKFFPNAISSLKKPDNTQNKMFIISKDNPLTWNLIFTGNDHNATKLQPYYNTNKNTLGQYYSNNLHQKYDDLKREYNEFKSIGFSDTSLESQKRELIEKENKINQLRGTDMDGYKGSD